MTPISRDDLDATHTLLVLEPAPGSVRLVFVDERTGTATTHHIAVREDGSATVRFARGQGAVEVRRAGAEALAFTRGGESKTTPVSDGEAALPLAGGLWRLRSLGGDRFTVEHEGGQRATVQPHTGALRDVKARDVWASGGGPSHTEALRAITCGVAARRLVGAATDSRC